MPRCRRGAAPTARARRDGEGSCHGRRTLGASHVRREVAMTGTENEPRVVPIDRFVMRGVGLTDVGVQRTQNEDAMYYDDFLGVYLVCDGMGGHASGQVAS